MYHKFRGTKESQICFKNRRLHYVNFKKKYRVLLILFTLMKVTVQTQLIDVLRPNVRPRLMQRSTLHCYKSSAYVNERKNNENDTHIQYKSRINKLQRLNA